MKNPFVKSNNNNIWIGAIAAGVIAAAAITYLYLRENTDNEGVLTTDDEPADETTVNIPKKKKQRTDVHELHPVLAN